MKNKTIILAGDSWSCGELDELPSNNRQVIHPGIAKYFSDAGYQVVNLSRLGGGNKHSAERVDEFLSVNKHLEMPVVVVFQTEWDRDIFAEDPDTMQGDIKEGYTEFKNRAVARFYYRLSEASVRNNVPIYLVGGCSDTDWFDNFETEYPGLHVVCQSLTNLILNGDHRVADPVYSIFGIGHEKGLAYIKQHIDTANLESLLSDMDAGNQRADSWLNNTKYFWPDGYHANRLGHQVLFEFLKTQIPEL